MTTAQVTRFVTSRGDIVESDLSNQQAIQLIRPMTWSTFALSLVQQFERRGLTAGQWPWVHKMALEQKAKASQPAPTTIQYSNIQHLFTHALKTGHKRPRITLDMEQGRIRLSVAGDMSKYPGAINVTDGGTFGSNVFYGRVSTDGVFTPSRNTPEWVVEALNQLDGSTLDFVVKYGQRTGNCCFCNRNLVTTESVTAGYGPICADTYGLPWG